MKYLLIIFTLAAALLITGQGCVTSGPADAPSPQATGATPQPESGSIETESMMEGAAWLDIPLTDVNSGEEYSLGEFKGSIVLVESFAVWCPTCTKQQKETKDLHLDHPEIVSVALDTDPNEDEGKVRSHTQSNGFDWRYSVSPIALTNALIDEFGVGIVSAPQAPMFIICEDQSLHLLGRGVKSAEELLQATRDSCA